MARNNSATSKEGEPKCTNNSKPKAGKTTVLDAGTVEARGHGTNASTREEVSAEIQAFLSGEAKFGWTSEERAFFTVWMFITRLPVPTWVDLHPGFLMRGMAYFPLGGALIGTFVGIFFDFAYVTLGLPSAVAATLSTASGLWMTGCFHEDGLADSADGIGGGWSRAQILRIMTDTRLGTFGCAALIIYTVAKVELLAALDKSRWGIFDLRCEGRCGSDGAGPALLVAHTLARMTSPYLIRTRNYVDEAGPKSKFYSFMVQAKYLVTWQRVLFAITFSSVLASVIYGPLTAFALVTSVLAFAHFAGRWGDYLLGGVMGDFLGATICTCELLILMLILLQKSAPSFLLSCVDAVALLKMKENTASFNAAMDALWLNEKACVLLRFIAAVSFTAVWKSFVGHPDVLVRESESTTVVASESEGNDKKSQSSTENSPRTSASRMLSSPGSTFEERYDAVQLYLDALAKPVGSLGTLEEWAARLAALQRTMRPDVSRISCLIFAADHGAAADPSEGGEGCSLYPQAVTRSVLEGLEREVAGASVLAKTNGVSLRVVDVGVKGASFDGDVVISSVSKLADGTWNFCAGPAMSAEEAARCIKAGRNSLVEFVEKTSSKVVVLGEVGIGNTTSASAIIAALTGETVESVCGGGAFSSRSLDEDAVSKKAKIVRKALSMHGGINVAAAQALAKVGGAEIAALVGAMLEASDRDIPVLVDGFIVTAAALVAASISPTVCRVLFFASQSAERGQRAAVEKIRSIAKEGDIPVPASPALSMSLRMGEATAALLAVPVLRSAAAVLSDMATIQDILEDGS